MVDGRLCLFARELAGPFPELCCFCMCTSTLKAETLRYTPNGVGVGELQSARQGPPAAFQKVFLLPPKPSTRHPLSPFLLGKIPGSELCRAVSQKGVVVVMVLTVDLVGGGLNSKSPYLGGGRALGGRGCP